MMVRAQTEGFTLIEALVAMAVLAVGAVTMLTAVENHARRLSGLSDRVVARWVAEERLTRLSLGQPEPDVNVAMMGRDWSIGVGRTATSDPDLGRVDIRVALAGADTPLLTLTGFIDTTKGATP